MPDTPEGLEPEHDEDSPFIGESEMKVCPNCGGESNIVVARGKKKGFCPMCKETSS